MFQKIYSIVSKIPKGKVLTYKKVSSLVGIKNPRIVGFALHANKNSIDVPCHRVVHANGELAKGYAFGGAKAQRAKLKEEGVGFIENKVNLSRFLFNG